MAFMIPPMDEWMKIGGFAPEAHTRPLLAHATGYVNSILAAGEPGCPRRRNDPVSFTRKAGRISLQAEISFLVGRDTEMAALAEARQLWKLGRAVSVMVVGARGSGKTSLLKCAVTSIFDGRESPCQVSKI